MYYLLRLLCCFCILLWACKAKVEPPTEIVVANNVDSIPIKTKPVLILDAGHGGADPGAVNDSLNLFEKNITRKLVDAILNKIDTNKITVIETRTKDLKTDRHNRIKYANLFNPDLLLTIHSNFDDDSTINGFEISLSDSTIMSIAGTDTLRKSNPCKDSCKKYASIVEKSLRTSFPTMRSRNISARKDNIWMICAPHYPSLLVEFGFISSYKDLPHMTNKKEIDKFASSIVKSIYKIFRVG